MSSERRRAAYAALDAAVREVLDARTEVEEGDVEFAETLTDWVVVAGCQFYDEGGGRCGSVTIIPQDASQPSYITTGLLETAIGHVR